MKTRREFLKTMLGGTAILATAVMVPWSLFKSVKPKELSEPNEGHSYWYGVDPAKPNSEITTGYVFIESNPEPESWIKQQYEISFDPGTSKIIWRE